MKGLDVDFPSNLVANAVFVTFPSLCPPSRMPIAP
jgi:hypothetical protein